MPRYIALLRAINVGGHIVKMDELRSCFESLEFSGVETFIASGNVIFESSSKATASLERRIESCLHKTFGYEVATFLRTDSEVAAIAQYKPFSDSALKTSATLNIGFVAGPLESETVRKLMKFKSPIDDFHVNDREIYWLCKKKQSESTFSNVLFERSLGVRATFRGMNTILRLAAKYPPR